MTAKWTETTETTVPARVEREETEIELWTHKRSAHRCHQHPVTPTEIGRGLQALEPAERAEALTAAGVEPTPPATPEEIGEVLAGLEPDERGRALDAAGVPLATPDDLAGVVAALPPDERLRVLRALGAKPAPARTPEALGAELAALDDDERWQALRAAGISAVVRAPQCPVLVPAVLWSEISVAVGGGGGGSGYGGASFVGDGGGAFVTAQVLAEAQAELDRMRAARDRLEREVRNERNGAAGLRDALAAMKRERDGARDALAVTLSAADACATATAARLAGERDRAQAERDRAQLEAAAVAQRLEDTTRILKRVQGERDQAQANARNAAIAAEYRCRVTAAERDAARAESATLRQGRDVAVAQIATELERVRELATERDRVRAERAQEVAIGNQALAELAALREALNQPALGAYRIEQTGSRAAAVTEDDGASVEVRVGCMSNLVRVPGDRWICLGSILRAARAAGALP